MSQNERPQDPNRIAFQMQIDPATESGTFSNFMTILHSETEFMIDFGMVLPGRNVIRIGSRIIASPRHAKQLLLALTDNIGKYEQRFGEISVDGAPDDLPPTPPTIIGGGRVN